MHLTVMKFFGIKFVDQAQCEPKQITLDKLRQLWQLLYHQFSSSSALIHVTFILQLQHKTESNIALVQKIIKAASEDCSPNATW